MLGEVQNCDISNMQLKVVKGPAATARFKDFTGLRCFLKIPEFHRVCALLLLLKVLVVI